MRKFVAVIVFLSFVVLPAHAQWTTSTKSDPINDTASHFAFSPQESAHERLGSPYGGMRASLAYGCDEQSEWAYVTFTKRVNLGDVRYSASGAYVDTQVRYDDDVNTITLQLDTVSKHLHIVDDSAFIQRMISSNEIIMRFPWAGEGNIHYTFDMSGSADTINRARQQCR